MTALSSMIAWYARRPGMDERATARHFKTSIHTVREAVQAWRTVEALGPLLKQANDAIRKIDKLGPASDDWSKAEAGRLREERRRCRISSSDAARAAGLSVRKYMAFERGARCDQDLVVLAHRLRRKINPAFDTDYVLHGKRGGA